MQVLVTGAQGFIGKNLILRLKEDKKYSILTFCRYDDVDDLYEQIAIADVVVHLAGENRPKDITAFEKVNYGLTQSICDSIIASGRKIPLLIASSIQANQNNPYGESKLSAELAVEKLFKKTGNPVFIYRLPNVFGKWCKPNYNSVVATFCYNVAHDLPLQVNDESAQLKLVYVDDVVAEFIRAIQFGAEGIRKPEITPEYSITIGELARQIKAFKDSRKSLVTEPVGKGLIRALYSTYISYLEPDQFSYYIPRHDDQRGVFVEIIKTKDSGQISYFTALPGVTRGRHYHHSKTEKFLVIKGKARFGFRHLITGETFTIFTCGDEPQIVDSVPGWIHDITNVGEDEILVMLWANEIFNRNNPDTISAEM